MTKQKFRIILLFYFLLMMAGIIVSFQDGKRIPADIIKRANNTKYIFRAETPFVIQVTIVSIMGLATLLIFVGLAGMLFFWSKARHLFTLSVIVTVLYPLSYKWSVHSSFSEWSDGIGSLFTGIIICMVFWGNAKPLFETEREKPEESRGQLPIS
jgi:hypothetical protein